MSAPFAYAQESTTPPDGVPNIGGPTSGNTPGAVSCFDYYSFGSVQVDLAPTLEQTVPGTPLTFTGEVTNDNPYPLVDGQVWVKIFKLNPNASEEVVKEDGEPLVDFLLVRDNITLPARGRQALTFDWNVPTRLGSGNYEAAFYFTTARRYNLLGLSFTDDVTGNKAAFTISPMEGYEPVIFNKQSATLNGKDIGFALPPLHFGKNESVTASAELVNPSNETRLVTLEWITSKWDGLLADNELKRESQTITLNPKERKVVTYTPGIYDTAVTFLQAIVKDGDAQSILHMRFVRDDVLETRINFPSVYGYPFVAGKEATIFSCVHSTNMPLVGDSTLTLAVKDAGGKVVHSYEYKGDITGAMMGLKDNFVPSENLSTFTLTATLTQGGRTLEEVSVTYDCSQIDNSTCVATAEAPAAESSDGMKIPLYVYTILAMVLVLALIGALILLRKKHSLHDDVPMITPTE